MKFIDEAKIIVAAGDGGKGVIGFRREKYIAQGGPDGGDGGDGGSVYLQASSALNTLVDFRFKRHFGAQNGKAGGGANCTGRSGEDLVVPVPIGTMVYDEDTGELIGDLVKEGQQVRVAAGGFHGLGNTRFKSSVQRAPRKCTPGSEGERRTLKLELKLLADIGLLGMPNAGKSTLISVVSAAQPKIADYPFTTLSPQLGVVKVEPHRSFVIADIPGLIEGAADGAGLGTRFLKHLARTSLLLHLIDVLPPEGSEDPVTSARKIVAELGKYSSELSERPRWLVLNKTDLLSGEQREQVCTEIVKALDWDGPVFEISAISQQGTRELMFAIMEKIEQEREAELAEADDNQTDDEL